MSEPFFSVVIPTFNQCNYLKRALKSVLNQKFHDYEIIVIDNFSNDKTESIVKGLKKKNIIYRKIRNRGIISKSRNKGIKLSKGKWVAFLDSDDIWHKDKLKKVYEMAKKENFEVICNDEWIIKKTGRRKKIWRYGPFKENFYKYLLEFGNCLSTSASVVKKSFIKKNNINFNERNDFVTAEDFDFFLKIARKNGIFFFLHLPLGEHLFHNKSESFNYEKHKNSSQAVLKHHIFKVQKFNINKKKIWRKANFHLTFQEFIIKLKNKEINFNLFKKVFALYLFNPIFSLIFTYKMIVKRLIQIYSAKKNMILSN
mgnify:CR=1 FL=1